MQSDPVTVAFLHSLQRDLFGPRQQSRAEADSDLIRAVRSAITEDDRRAVGDVDGMVEQTPTPYEPAIGYSILTELAAAIVTALREDVELPNPPLVGTLPVGWPTALLLRVPGSANHVALVDREFTIFSNLLAKVCAQALVPASRNASLEAWEASFGSGSHPAIQRYLELMFATMTGSPVAAPAYLPAPELSGLLNQIRTAIEVFVVSEPFVHLALGHTDEASLLALPALHPRAESYQWTRSQRTESFVIRLAVVASVFEKRALPDKALGYWSVEMFLFTLALLQTVQASGRGNGSTNESWAPTELEWLREVLLQSEGERSRSIELFDRLAPVPRAFAAHMELALRTSGPRVH